MKEPQGWPDREGIVVVELNIDWRGLYSAFQTNTAEYRCYLCMDDGEVVKLAPADPQLEQIRKDPARFMNIEVVPSRIQYQWVTEFVKTIETEPTQRRMEAAINGKGAFRRFKDILLTLPDERRRWFEFRDRKMRNRVIEWVKEHGITPTNEPSWTDPAEAAEEADPSQAVSEAIVAWAEGLKPEITLPEEATGGLIAKLLADFHIRSK